MIAGLAARLQTRWYAPQPWACLKPLAGLFGVVVALRRWLYRHGWLATHAAPCPLLVVGNISVGGSGKTPLILALVERARAQGGVVGVISRGYGGKTTTYPLAVNAETPAALAGDEPALIARRTGVPVVVAPDRVSAARQMCQLEPRVQLILADDGLQHYRLRRDAEIAVTDDRRAAGNGWLLPAGPLREPASRLDEVDLVARHGPSGDFRLVISQAVSLADGQHRDLSMFSGQPVHAVAGIGDPSRFFDALRDLGLTIIPHPKPDHHRYVAADIRFDDEAPVLVTEKDAVKCAGLVDGPAGARLWMVPAEAVLDPAFAARCDRLIAGLLEDPTPQERP